MASMIESVKARRRGAQDFEGYYSQLCALQDTCPLATVKAHLADGVLDLNADRVRQPDWMPIINALRINRSLQYIAIRSYFQQNSKQDDPRSRSQTTVHRPPPIRSRDLTHRLSLALRECLSSSEQLQHLELQGLPLREKNVNVLCSGLAKTRCLQHLSLEFCRIGDPGVESLCKCLKTLPCLVSVNLTAAGLTWKSADMLAKLVKHQSTKRHTDAWMDSLRYRRPDLDRMPGLRRITINDNPLINDKGALTLAEALKDDLWIKALDMQHCGLSNTGAQAFLDTLHHNTSIVVLDLRRNQLIDRDLLKAVIEQVMINSGGKDDEYKWLRAKSPTNASSSKSRRRGRASSSAQARKSGRSRAGSKSGSSQRIGSSSHQRLGQQRSRTKSAGSATAVEQRSRSRSKSAGGVLVHREGSRKDLEPAITRPGPGFIPWRTAARANQRSKEMVAVDPGSPDSASTPTRPAGTTSIHVHVGQSGSALSSGLDTSAKDSVDSQLSAATEEGFRALRVSRKTKDLQVEAEELRRRLYIESRARAAADARIVELEVENSRLKHHTQLLEARGPSSPLKGGKGGAEEEDGDEDDALLESIEESFRKFHGFLDLLRDAGLGQLCTLVGIGTDDVSHPLVKSILKSHQPSDGPQLATHQVPQPPQPASQQMRQPSTYGVSMPAVHGVPAPPEPPSQQSRHPSTYGVSIPPTHGVPAQHEPPSHQTRLMSTYGVSMPSVVGSAQVGASHSQHGQAGQPYGMPLGFEGYQQGQAAGTVPLGYPPMPAAYTHHTQNANFAQVPSGAQVLGGQSSEYHAPPQPMSYYAAQQPPQMTNQPIVHHRPTPGGVFSNQQSSTPQVFVSVAQTQESVRTSDVLTNVAHSNHVTAPIAKERPPETHSSTEGVFTPSAVEITSELPLHSKDRQTSSETSAPTVRPQHRAQQPQAWKQEDSEPSQRHPSPGPGLDSPTEQGQEPELTKASDSIDFDLGKHRAIDELHFEDSDDESPEKRSLDFGKDDSSAESLAPSKGIGSPTESDHSARDRRGSPRGASPNQDYSDDFDDDNDLESESDMDDDLFRDSDGGVPGLSSDEDF